MLYTRTCLITASSCPSKQALTLYLGHLVYTWERTNTILGYSDVIISWETESYSEAGTYRTRYYGDWKAVDGTITAFNGTSDAYTLTA